MIIIKAVMIILVFFNELLCTNIPEGASFPWHVCVFDDWLW